MVREKKKLQYVANPLGQTKDCGDVYWLLDTTLCKKKMFVSDF